jgi:hypothetical protein
MRNNVEIIFFPGENPGVPLKGREGRASKVFALETNK